MCLAGEHRSKSRVFWRCGAGITLLTLSVAVLSCGHRSLGPFDPDPNIIDLEILNGDTRRVQFEIGGRQWWPVLANSTRHYEIHWFYVPPEEIDVFVRSDPDHVLAQTRCTVPEDPTGGRIMWDGTTLTCTIW